MGEEVLQGEPVMQGHRGGILNDQAHLSVLAFTQRAICKRESDASNVRRTDTNAAVGLTQIAEQVWRPESVNDPVLRSNGSVLCAEQTKLEQVWQSLVTPSSPDRLHFPNADMQLTWICCI